MFTGKTFVQLHSYPVPLQYKLTCQVKMVWKSYMYVRAKIVKTNGDSLSDSDKAGVVNLFLPSLFEQCTVTLQGKMITSSTGHYPYRAMIQTLLKI